MDPVFYVQRDGNTFRLREEEMHHMDVLRMSLPCSITFTDGKGCLFTGKADREGIITEYQRIDAKEPENINLYYGVCDKSREKIILEKCTELGVKSFNPIITENSEQYAIRPDRAEKIIISAIKQSRRFVIPSYREKELLGNILKKGIQNAIYGSLSGSGSMELNLNEEINIFIGPPSGFTKKEESEMSERGIIPFHMHSAVLRTETFAIAVMSVIKYLQGV